MSASSSARPLRSSAALAAGSSFAARLAANTNACADNSVVATAVMRASSSCASSTITTSCSGKIFASANASIASIAWLVTTTSTSDASARAFSAKQSAPKGQREAPMHSLAVTDTARHTVSGTPGARSSRSPVSESWAKSRTRCICAPNSVNSTGEPESRLGCAASSASACPTRCRHT